MSIAQKQSSGRMCSKQRSLVLVDGIRNVSTSLRQVASEFSVDFPLSRWPVWVG
jgi:hypothetical protein